MEKKLKEKKAHKHNLRWSNIERVIYCECGFSIGAEEILKIVDRQHKIQLVVEELDAVREANFAFWFDTANK